MLLTTSSCAVLDALQAAFKDKIGMRLFARTVAAAGNAGCLSSPPALHMHAGAHPQLNSYSS